MSAVRYEDARQFRREVAERALAAYDAWYAAEDPDQALSFETVGNLVSCARWLLDATGGGDQAAEDTRRLAGIREVLAHFDWDHHDRQLALEAIERIAGGGQP